MRPAPLERLLPAIRRDVRSWPMSEVDEGPILEFTESTAANRLHVSFTVRRLRTWYSVLSTPVTARSRPAWKRDVLRRYAALRRAKVYFHRTLRAAYLASRAAFSFFLRVASASALAPR